MSNAFLYRMPSGIPGALSRTGLALIVEPGILLSGSAPASYGLPVAVDPTTGHVRAIAGTDTAASVYGFLVRPFPTQGGDGVSTSIGTSAPPASGQVDVLKLGYMSVYISRGTPVKGGTVYVRIVANATYPTSPVGGVEAAADGINTVALTNAYFTGAADANGNAEIAFNV
jgi:hypothetical protein